MRELNWVEDMLAINRSIIQSSGVGPCLFLAMIADLKLRNATTIFADDLTMLIAVGYNFITHD